MGRSDDKVLDKVLKAQDLVDRLLALADAEESSGNTDKADAFTTAAWLLDDIL